MALPNGINIGAYIRSLDIQWWGQVTHISSYSLILYDILITLDQEIEYIWRAKWSLGKLAFLIIRYLNIVIKTVTTIAIFSPFVTNELVVYFLGLFWIRFQTLASFIMFMAIDLVLLMRLHALFARRRAVLIAMVVPFALLIITSTMELILYSVEVRETATPLPGVPNFCETLPGKVNRSYLYWAALLGLEFYLFVLVCVKAFQSYREEYSDLWSSGIRFRTLTEVIIRDSVLYFFAIFVTYLANVIISPLDQGDLAEIPTGYATALSGIMSQRLILNMREAYHKNCTKGHESIFDVTTWQAATPASVPELEEMVFEERSESDSVIPADQDRTV